jgi:hypothetical protein
MRESTSRKSIGVALLLIFLLFGFWYVEAGNFSDSNVPGTYVFQQNGERSTLILRADHSFQQQLEVEGRVSRASGSWRLFPSDSQSHIGFSKEFLKLSNQKINPDGTAYGGLENIFGLLSITLGPSPDGPTFRKKWFH